MKNSLFKILIGSLFVLSCDKDDISQTQADEFVKFYTYYPEFTAADVAVTPQGYAVLGTAKTIDDATWICLLRTDEYGNSTDSVRLYGISDENGADNRAYCLRAMSDGGFAILGSVRNPNTGLRSVYFVRTNSAGDIVWTKTISRDGDVEACFFDVSSTESFYMTGYYKSGSDGREIWWFGLDSQGNDIRNQRVYGFTSDDEGTHLQILPDGRLVITGYITRASTTKAFIIKTDENTVFEALFELPAGGVSETGNCLFPLNNDHYLLLGTAASASGSQMTLKSILMSNTTQEIEWSKNYGSSVNESGGCLLHDNRAIYILGTTTLSSSNTSISLTTTDLTGNQSGRAEFGLGSRLFAKSFKRTTDNGFIILGTNIHAGPNNTSIALIKTREGAGL